MQTLKHLPPPISVFQPLPEHPMDNTALRATEHVQQFAQLLSEPAYVDTTPDFSKLEYLREDEVEEIHVYEILGQWTLDQIVHDARILEKAGRQVCIQFTRRKDKDRDTGEVVVGPINGIRLSVVR